MINDNENNDMQFFLSPLSRQRPALGKCLAAFSAAFPVAFLERHINKFNTFSIYNSKGAKDRAGTAQGGILFNV